MNFPHQIDLLTKVIYVKCAMSSVGQVGERLYE